MKAVALAILTLLLVVTGTVCVLSDRESEFSPLILKEAGSLSIGDSASVKVFKDENGKLNVEYKNDEGFQRWTEGFIEPSSSWFIFVENPKELWLVEEDDVCFIFDLPKSSGSYGLFNCHNDEVLNQFIYNRMPDELVKMLPNEILFRADKAIASNHIFERDDQMAEAFKLADR